MQKVVHLSELWTNCFLTTFHVTEIRIGLITASGTSDRIWVSYSTSSDHRRDQDSQKRPTILLKIL